MNVLVIGGTQYFGKVIVRRLLERGDSVTVYSRGNSRPEFWADVAHILGDRTDYDDFRRNLEGKRFDAVIDNLAFRLEDTRAVVEALGDRVGKYLISSSASVYGGRGHALGWYPESDRTKPLRLREYVDLRAHCPVREEDLDLASIDWRYDPEIDPYAQGKRHIERYLHETPDFPSVVLRVPAVLGPEATSLRFWWYLQRIEDEREIVLRDGGSNIFRNGYRDDVAQAFVDAMASPTTANQIYNIAQAEIMTLRRFLQVIAEQAGRKLNAVPVPGDVADALGGLPWAKPYYDSFSHPPSYVMSIEKARRDFNLRSTPVEQWVGTTVEWYRTQFDGRNSYGYDRRDDEVEFARWWSREFGRFVQGATPPAPSPPPGRRDAGDAEGIDRPTDDFYGTVPGPHLSRR